MQFEFFLTLKHNTMKKIDSYRDLPVWQKAIAMGAKVYRLTQNFPSEEMESLIDPMRKAALAVPLNISQGHNNPSKTDSLQFIDNAKGSLARLDSMLVLSTELQFATENETQEISDLCVGIDTMLIELNNKLLSPQME